MAEHVSNHGAKLRYYIILTWIFAWVGTNNISSQRRKWEMVAAVVVVADIVWETDVTKLKKTHLCNIYDILCYEDEKMISNNMICYKN